MTLFSNLTRVASHVQNKPIITIFTFLVIICTIESVLARDMALAGQHTAIRRLDCSVFCRKTGFSGYVGGCQCGFTLFANKRSQLLRARLYQSPTAKIIYPENNLLSDDESIEEVDLRAGSKDRQLGLGAR